jgi:Tfp pilus assembly protein PilF
MNRLAALLEMLAESPNDSFLRYGIALEYAKADDRKKAIQLIEELIVDQPEYLGAYYQLGQYYEQENESEKAADIYQRGMTLAEKQGNKKTLGELKTALEML